MGTVEGKVALVTGAARGQGRQHAVRLAEQGADIIAVDICDNIDTVTYPLATQADLEETAAMVEKFDRRIITRVADVRDYAAMQKVVADGVAELGRLDIVVANAGIWAVHVDEPTDPAVRQKIWKDTIDINLTGVWNTVEAAAPVMVKLGNGGSIVMTCSTQGLKGAANNDISLTSYCTAKHGMVGLMRSQAVDLAPHSIRVNTIHPTGVVTDMVTNDTVGQYMEKHPKLGELMGNKLPVPVVETDDIANAMLFLVSDSGRYITGITLPVDAGHLL